MIMANARSLAAIVVGALVTVLAIYWSIQPLGFFDSFCITQPCSMSLVFAGVLFVIGVAILIGGIVALVRSHKAQTMVISMGSDAEKDANAVSSIQSSVESGENADEKLEDGLSVEDYKPHDEEFLKLPSDEQAPAAGEPAAATPANEEPKAPAKPAAKKPAKAVVKKAPVKKPVPKKAVKPAKKAVKKKK
jgi:outer membrane biosynthesis protein TonB